MRNVPRLVLAAALLAGASPVAAAQDGARDTAGRRLGLRSIRLLRRPLRHRRSTSTQRIARILGRRGRVSGGVYQLNVARAERITEAGREIPPSMGLATVINFQPTGAGRAAITGDFVMTASEVSAVIRTLREHGIQVTALHSHMFVEQPRLFFMHFWANDDAARLAGGLRAALDRTTWAR